MLNTRNGSLLARLSHSAAFVHDQFTFPRTVLLTFPPKDQIELISRVLAINQDWKAEIRIVWRELERFAKLLPMNHVGRMST